MGYPNRHFRPDACHELHHRQQADYASFSQRKSAFTMTSNRDEFTKETINTLKDRVNNLCSNPSCRCPTSGPHHAADKASRIGVAAHITAAAAGGPRYDPTLRSEERCSINNGIWLCQNCARLVDVDPETYPVNDLRSWRRQAEAERRAELEHGGRINLPAPSAEQQPLGDWECPHCGTGIVEGRTVCLGCHAEVVYGATRYERADALKMGLLLGGGVSAALIYGLPVWLGSALSTTFSAGWGWGTYSIVPIPATAIATAMMLSYAQDTWYRRRPPRFFRSSVT